MVKGMDKWSKISGVTRIIYTFPKGERIIIDRPLWEQRCTTTGKRFFITSDGRDFTVNGHWLLAEYEGNPALLPSGDPNVILLDKEDE